MEQDLGDHFAGPQTGHKQRARTISSALIGCQVERIIVMPGQLTCREAVRDADGQSGEPIFGDRSSQLPLSLSIYRRQ